MSITVDTVQLRFHIKPDYDQQQIQQLQSDLKQSQKNIEAERKAMEKYATQHAVTFQTFDPNHIDPRQVYVIQNRRYVVRDVEETITAEGRQPESWINDF